MEALYRIKSGEVLRRAKSEDLDSLTQLLRLRAGDGLSAGESGFDPKAARVCLAAILDRNDCIIVVVERNNALMGMMCARAMPDLVDGSRSMASDICSVIDPSLDRHEFTAYLLAALEGWASAIGCRVVHSASAAAVSSREIENTYVSQGFAPAAIVFTKQLCKQEA